MFVRSDLLVAVHEAGHACVALAFGLKVTEVWIKAVGEYVEGFCGYETSGNAFQHHGLVFTVIAGRVAEELLLKGNSNGSGYDALALHALLGPRNQRHLPLLIKQTGPLIRSLQPAIMTLARALLKKRRLSGKQVVRLVGSFCSRQNGHCRKLAMASNRFMSW